MKIHNHMLDEADTSIQSPNKGGKIEPVVIVLHYTASGGEDGSGDAEYLSRASSRASAHVVVGRDGSVHQIIPFNEKAWHAGKSKWNGKSNVNGFSIGIEIDNWGWLDHGFKSHAGVKIPDEFVFEGERSGHKYWEAYRDEQLAAVESVVDAIVAEYPIVAIVGHEDVSPGRKQDPGPALDKFMAKLNEKYDLSEPKPAPKKKTTPEGTKESKVNGLRVRARADYSSLVLTHLVAGQSVEILTEDIYPGWDKVKVGSKIGFVVNSYLT